MTTDATLLPAPPRAPATPAAAASRVPIPLPADFEWTGAGPTFTAVRVSARAELEPLLRLGPAELGPAAGRGTVQRLAGRVAGGGVIYKRYRRGGLLGPWLGELHGGLRGVTAELGLAEEAAARGLEVPSFLALRVTRRAPGVWSAEAFFREIPDAEPLAAACAALAAPEFAARRRRLLRQVGAAVRRMHDVGLRHADLNARNLLVQGGAPAVGAAADAGRARIWIVDLRGARIGDPVDTEGRMANLARLCRSAAKIAALDRSLAPTDRLRLLAGYEGAAPFTRGEKRTLVARCRRDVARHRLWWRLAGVLPGAAPHQVIT